MFIFAVLVEVKNAGQHMDTSRSDQRAILLEAIEEQLKGLCSYPYVIEVEVT